MNRLPENTMEIEFGSILTCTTEVIGVQNRISHPKYHSYNPKFTVLITLHLWVRIEPKLICIIILSNPIIGSPAKFENKIIFNKISRIKIDKFALLKMLVFKKFHIKM